MREALARRRHRGRLRLPEDRHPPARSEAQRTNLADARLDPAVIQPTAGVGVRARVLPGSTTSTWDRYVVEAADGQTPAPDRARHRLGPRAERVGISDATGEAAPDLHPRYGLALAPANSTNSRVNPTSWWGSRPRPTRPPGASGPRSTTVRGWGYATSAPTRAGAADRPGLHVLQRSFRASCLGSMAPRACSPYGSTDRAHDLESNLLTGALQVIYRCPSPSGSTPSPPT